jgi:hypothetical protein
MQVSERDFLKKCIEKILNKNKWIINDLYPYMGTPFLSPLGLFLLLCTSGEKKPISFVGDNPMNIPTNLGSNWRF